MTIRDEGMGGEKCDVTIKCYIQMVVIANAENGENADWIWMKKTLICGIPTPHDEKLCSSYSFYEEAFCSTWGILEEQQIL